MLICSHECIDLQLEVRGKDRYHDISQFVIRVAYRFQVLISKLHWIVAMNLAQGREEAIEDGIIHGYRGRLCYVLFAMPFPVQRVYHSE